MSVPPVLAKDPNAWGIEDTVPVKRNYTLRLEAISKTLTNVKNKVERVWMAILTFFIIPFFTVALVIPMIGYGYSVYKFYKEIKFEVDNVDENLQEGEIKKLHTIDGVKYISEENYRVIGTTIEKSIAREFICENGKYRWFFKRIKGYIQLSQLFVASKLFRIFSDVSVKSYDRIRKIRKAASDEGSSTVSYGYSGVLYTKRALEAAALEQLPEVDDNEMHTHLTPPPSPTP